MTPAVLERARLLKQEADAHQAALRESARRHQREKRHHKGRLRATMAELEAFCAEHGIPLTIIDTDPRRSQPDEQHRDNRTT